MPEDKFIMFRNRIVKVQKHLDKTAKRLNVSCYRLYDHDLPEFPFCMEFYADKLYIAEYKRRHGMGEEEHDEWMEKCLEIIREVLRVPKENIFLKLRQRKPGRLGQYQKLEDKKSEFIVEENGLKFIVNLSDYLDTGLFLDHRITREKVRAESRDKSVLNLFAYTGSFSVYAGAGGAKEVVTIDLSKTYLQWSERNMQLNGFTDERKYKFVHADVLQYLPGIPGDTFDIIVLDPPTFSNSKRMDNFFDIQRDHVSLINECLRILNKGGILYFSTNFRQFDLDKEKIRSSSIKDITRQTTPFDFEKKLFRLCFQINK
jgi:23S rRNA (cytosine1962-C5)-methyltransferase